MDKWKHLFERRMVLQNCRLYFRLLSSADPLLGCLKMMRGQTPLIAAYNPMDEARTMES